jgi:transcriptional regulator with XRE-family HTH domain
MQICMALNKRQMAKFIRDLRLGLRLSQTEFGAHFNVSQSAVSHWENAKHPSTPESEHLPKLAAMANINLEALFGDQPNDLPSLGAIKASEEEALLIARLGAAFQEVSRWRLDEDMSAEVGRQLAQAVLRPSPMNLTHVAALDGATVAAIQGELEARRFLIEELPASRPVGERS